LLQLFKKMELEMSLKKIKNNYKVHIFAYFILMLFNHNIYSETKINYFNYIKDLKSFSTLFTQYTFSEDGSLIKESNGSLLYKKKSMYVLEYNTPNKIKFISDGQFITTYDKDLEQVIIQSFKDKINNNVFSIMTNEDLIRNKFKINSYVTNGDIHFKFKPIKKSLNNNVFLLVIKDSSIKKITFMNDLEQSVTMDFNNFKKNISIKDSSFKIDIPDNFDVIIDK